MQLFDVLPDELFRPLASPSRRFFAALLLSLHEKTFSMSANAPRRADVLAEIADFTARYETQVGSVGEDIPQTSREERARGVYQRLLDTGWLIEHKDRYIRLVDLDPDASGLLHVLASIMRGNTRSYGGAVISVLSALENAAANPTERSENISNAVRASYDFLAHMRLVSVSLRKVEDKILRQDNLRDFYRSFFEDFVEKHLVADFKTLHTKNNPFRFRSAIIRQARGISSSPLLVMKLGEAYHAEGRAASAAMGQVAVLDDLAVIVNTFESTEGHLAAIDATAANIEKRMMNTARYMDRVGRSSEASIIEAMKTVAAVETDVVPVTTAMAFRSLPIGPAHISMPRREKPPVDTSTVRVSVKEPAFERFLAAKADYLTRTKVTPTGFIAYIEKVIGNATSVRGSDIVIDGPDEVDDFISFQRLREIATIFDGSISRKFDIELLPERITNDWIDCQDFVIRRKSKRARNG
jgi:hypothetical protein